MALTAPFFDGTGIEAVPAFREPAHGQGVSIFPTSFAQERWWFRHQFEPGRYNTSLVFHLPGKLNISALLQSISALVRRHEMLRTHVVTRDGCLLQSISPDLVIPLPFVDLQAVGKEQRTTLVEQLAHHEARAPFDLEHGPLMRATLLQVDLAEHFLLFTLHQSIADAWSASLCLNELNLLYSSFTTGRPSPLPDLPVHYADYAAWQQEWLQGTVLEQEVSYWKTLLDDAPVLELPVDHPRPVGQGPRYASQPFALPAMLTQELKLLSHRSGVTLFMTLLAGFQVLLARLTGQRDIVVGAPVAGRTQVEVEGLIGLFANTIMLRCHILPDSTFDELLEQVRDGALEAYEHQELPFDQVVEALSAQRSFGNTSPVQFAFQNISQAVLAPESSPFQLVYEDAGMDITQVDLALTLWEDAQEEGSLRGKLKYNMEVFESATITRWAKHLRLLLECIAADCQQRLSTLLSLSDTELQQLLERWNTLATIWEKVLRVERPGIHTNFFEAGGDSILSLLVIARAREAGLFLTPKDIFEHQTIAELVQVATTTTSVTNTQETTDGKVPLTPIQHWFFGQQLPDPHHWNQSILLEITNPRIDPPLLERAITGLLEHHSALSLCFTRGTQDWEQDSRGGEAQGAIVRSVNLSALQPGQQEHTLEEEATFTQTSLNLEDGPLLRVVYFAMGTNLSRLLIVIHHLAIDTVSWRILLEDLQTACQQLLRGEDVHLPPKTTSFKTWAEQLQAYTRSQEIRQQAAYWLAEERRNVPSLPIDFPNLPVNIVNTEAASSSISMSLSITETDALLHEVPGAYHTRMNEILLAALLLTCGPWTGRRKLLVDVEGHGREALIEGVDLSRTVGWFTTIFPVLLNLESIPASAGLGQTIQTIKEQVRGIPQHGIGYGLLRYLSNVDEVQAKLQEMPQSQMSFNYLGQVNSLVENPTHALFHPAHESTGPVHSLRGRRMYLLDVTGIVTQGQFHIEWRYCTQLHRRETIEMLARRYLEMLRDLIEHCHAPEADGGHSYTPSDFSGSRLNQAKLDKLIAKIRSNQQT